MFSMDLSTAERDGQAVADASGYFLQPGGCASCYLPQDFVRVLPECAARLTLDGSRRWLR
jgi:hypothetical protein